MGRGIVVQQGQTAHCSKLWTHAGNALQQSSHNLDVENIIDSLPFVHKFFMNFLVCQRFCSWTSANDIFWALVMTLRSIAWPEVPSLSHIEIPMTHPQLHCKQENWDVLTSLDEALT
jgi:hypothetical protein